MAIGLLRARSHCEFMSEVIAFTAHLPRSIQPTLFLRKSEQMVFGSLNLFSFTSVSFKSPTCLCLPLLHPCPDHQKHFSSERFYISHLELWCEFYSSHVFPRSFSPQFQNRSFEARLKRIPERRGNFKGSIESVCLLS